MWIWALNPKYYVWSLTIRSSSVWVLPNPKFYMLIQLSFTKLRRGNVYCAPKYAVLRRWETWHKVKWNSGTKCHLFHYHFHRHPKKFHSSRIFQFCNFEIIRYICFLIYECWPIFWTSIPRKNTMPSFFWISLNWHWGFLLTYPDVPCSRKFL